MSDLDRFMAKVSPEPNSGCWLWVGAARQTGYGNFFLGSKSISAHRAAWLLHRGGIPDGMCVCHHCDVPSCVNPEHLFLGTHLDNMRDMDAKGRRVVSPHDGANNPMFGKTHSACAKALQSAAKKDLFTGSKHPRASITETQALEVLAMRREAMTAKQIAERVKISFHIVRNIINKKSWGHVCDG